MLLQNLDLSQLVYLYTICSIDLISIILLAIVNSCYPLFWYIRFHSLILGGLCILLQADLAQCLKVNLPLLIQRTLKSLYFSSFRLNLVSTLIFYFDMVMRTALASKQILPNDWSLDYNSFSYLILNFQVTQHVLFHSENFVSLY